MSTPDANADPQSPLQGPLAGRWQRNELGLVLVVMLSAFGIGVTDFSPERGFWYWLAMVPIFGFVSLFAALLRPRRAGETTSAILLRQILHWVALLLAIYLIFLLVRAGRMTNESAGLVALLSLALTAFLGGVHGDWRFCVVGLLLGGIVAGATFVEEFLWMLLIPAVMIMALVVLWFARRRRAVPSTN